MAHGPEKKVKDRVTKILRETNTYYFMPAMNGYGRAGVPDIIGCANGKFFGIECKTRGNSPTPLQERELKGIRDAGGVSIVVNEDNIGEVQDLIDKLNKQNLH